MKKTTLKRVLSLTLASAMAMSVNIPFNVLADEVTTAASNGIELPELPDGTLSLEVSVAEYQQSSEGTMIQELWQKKMEEYLGCKLDITWTRTPAADYQANELVVLQSGMVPDVATLTKGSAVNEYGEDGTLLNPEQIYNIEIENIN